MDPLSIILGVAAVVSILTVTPIVAQGIADAIATARASKAGEWDLIDKDRSRRDNRATRRGEWWADRRRGRNIAAGGDGSYKPGFWGYVGEAYRAFFARRHANARAKRAISDPALFNPTNPDWRQRIDDAVQGRVGQSQGPTGRHHRDDDVTITDPPLPGQAEPTPHTGTGHPVAPPTPGFVDPAPEGTPRADVEPGDLPVFAPGTHTEGDLDHLSGPLPTCPRCGGPTSQAFTLCAKCDDAAFDEYQKRRSDKQGGAMTSPANVAEVTSNEALRQNFQQMGSAAARLADACAAAEAARNEVAALARASADGVAAKRFDQGATAAANEVADNIDVATLSEWTGLADNVKAAADAGVRALDKYIDSEALVAQENVDGSTLEPVAA